MTKITFTRLFGGFGLAPGSWEPFEFPAGHTTTVEDFLAAKWIAQGIAEAYTAAPERPATLSIPEIQVLVPQENTMAPRGRPKGSLNKYKTNYRHN